MRLVDLSPFRLSAVDDVHILPVCSLPLLFSLAVAASVPTIIGQSTFSRYMLTRGNMRLLLLLLASML